MRFFYALVTCMCILGGVTETFAFQSPTSAVGPKNDYFSTAPFYAGTGGSTISVMNNDSVNGIPNSANTGNVAFAWQSMPSSASNITLNSDGTITVAAGAKAGSYLFNYQICSLVSPSECKTAYATIYVDSDSDGDGVADLTDTDDDNDGILDSDECNIDLLSVYQPNNTIDPNFFLLLRPSDFGFTTLGAKNLSGTHDYSAVYGLPSGAIVVTVENVNVHPTADEFYIQHALGASNRARIRVSGTIGVFIVTEHGAEYYRRQERGITYLDGVTSQSGLVPFSVQPSVTASWESGNIEQYHYVRRLVSTPAMATAPFFLANTNAQMMNKFVEFYTDNTEATEFSTFFFRIYPECDTDKDGIPNRLDLDSDNDGCADANEYYHDGSAVGDDGNLFYGNGNPPSTNIAGNVTDALYSGSYTNVVTATQLGITTQPSDFSGNVGANAIFNVMSVAISTTTFASGTPDYSMPPASNTSAGLTYQWQVSTDGGVVWANISNGGQYTGATSATLAVNAITLGQNGHLYRVWVAHSGKVCPMASEVASLTINTYSISGTIFNDNDGVLGNANGVPVNGTASGTAPLDLIVNLYDGAGNFLTSAPVQSDGTYLLSGVPAGTGYQVQLNTAANIGEQGQNINANASALPGQYQHVSSSDNVTPGNGINIVDVVGDILGSNFGINQPPIAVPGAIDSQPNPGGGNGADITDKFSGTDADGGIIRSLTITAFPSNATSITIGGIIYTLAGAGGTTAWPVAGVTVPTTAAGIPLTGSEISIAPVDGTVTVVIPFIVTDNAGLDSPVTQLNAPFTPAMPVTLISLTGRELEGACVVSWLTTEEINSDRFAIEHSLNGKQWAIVGEVKAAGESKGPVSYIFSHQAPTFGINYYRLKMIDRDETFSYSKILSLRFTTLAELSAYPNPVAHVLTLKHTNSQTVKVIRLIDMAGREVYKHLHSSNQEQSSRIDVSGIRDGAYTVSVTHDDGSVETTKVLVLH